MLSLRFGDPSDVEAQSGELGFWLAPEWWGRGVMTAAVKVFVHDVLPLANARRALPVVRVASTVYAPNKASRRVLEKSGFEFEGRMRSAYRKNGVLVDGDLLAWVAPS
ncbi:hypothetical protein HK105_201082 [Polyrhizophydium stewartii]|uniref:N-acetyltransferase domain-containing protein n=1 Tax=Polyrhizophydium stewartii TaxID=2732419 RepID=A0ABR4NIU7_9FUNG